MKVSKLVILGVFLLMCAGTAFAISGKGGGAWHTGEMSEPAFASRWGYGSKDQGSVITVTADSAQTKSGKGSVVLSTTGTMDNWAYFPNTKDMDFDASACSAFKFSLRSEKTEQINSDPYVVFKDVAGNAATFKTGGNRMKDTVKGWVDFRVPAGVIGMLGMIDRSAVGTTPAVPEALADPHFDWKHIASFEIHIIQGNGYRVWYDGVEFVSEKPAKWWLSSIDKPDLSVTWAEQTPHYKRYLPDYSNPWPGTTDEDAKGKHWPDAGEKITYIVHIRNVGFKPSKSTDFVCVIDGQRVKAGKVSALAPQQETTIEVPWSWKHGPYKFEARVDTKGKMDEISKKNNLLAFNTDAYTLYAICEAGMTKQVDAVNNNYGSFSYEDWLRGSTVDAMNWLMKKSKYDFAPEGSKVTVRVGKVMVVDTATEEIRNAPDLINWDGGWVYGSKGAMEYCDLANTFMWALNHELTHQIGIIDDYMMNLEPTANKINGKGFNQESTYKGAGMMTGGKLEGNQPPAYADIDVVGMNATYGKRRGYFGEYLYNLPEKNTLVLSIDGKATANVDVKIYQKNEENEQMAGEPVFAGKTDSEGRFPLANRPVKKEFTTLTGCTLKPNPFGHISVIGANGLFLVRANVDGKWYYGLVDIARFAVEKARGHEDATYKIELKSEDTK